MIQEVLKVCQWDMRDTLRVLMDNISDTIHRKELYVGNSGGYWDNCPFATLLNRKPIANCPFATLLNKGCQRSQSSPNTRATERIARIPDGGVPEVSSTKLSSPKVVVVDQPSLKHTSFIKLLDSSQTETSLYFGRQTISHLTRLLLVLSEFTDHRKFIISRSI